MKQSLMKMLGNNFLIHTDLLTMITSLFYCWQKVFILMTKWLIGKISTKHHYRKMKVFIVT